MIVQRVSKAAAPVHEATSDVNAALRACRGAFVMTGAFSFFINLLMLTAPLYMLQVYDRVLSSRSESTLIALTVLAGAMLLVMGMLELVRSRILVRIGSRLDRDLNPRVFSAVFERSVRGFRGERVQALRDLDGLRQFLTGPGPFALFDAPWVPLYLGVVILFHPILGLVAATGALVLLVLGVLNEVLTRKVLQESNTQVVTAYAFAEASLRNAEVLKAMGMLNGIQRRWIDRHAQGLALQARASDRAGVLMACSKATRMFLQVAILGAGAMLAIHQVITPGVMIAASILMGRALAPVEQAIGSWRHFVGARFAYRRLQALLVETPSPAARLKLPRPEGHLSVENVVAVPPGTARPALKGISFALAAGEALGVIGPSAAGKTTLARLLVGVWSPYAGAVRLDGAELRNWDPADLGAHIGYLPQDVDLFAGTVAENISRFYADPDPDEIVWAAQLAGAHEMILRLPDGYDTEIGDNGSFLSGGQRQRIALARALFGSPPLVVLDEPNSNLDAAGDQALTEAVLKLKRQRTTVVVVAHRPSAIAAVDKLLMLRDGKAEAFGPKDEILARVTRHVVAAPGSNIATVGSRS